MDKTHEGLRTRTEKETLLIPPMTSQLLMDIHFVISLMIKEWTLKKDHKKCIACQFSFISHYVLPFPSNS